MGGLAFLGLKCSSGRRRSHKSVGAQGGLHKGDETNQSGLGRKEDLLFSDYESRHILAWILLGDRRHFA